jgi:hypothetical protein
MLFVLFFVAALLVVPLAVDAAKHGENHILRRVGADIANLETSKRLLTILHISVSSVRGAIATTVALGSTVIFVIAGWEIMRLLLRVSDFIVR